MLSLKMIKGSELADGVIAEMRLPVPLSRFSIGRDPGNHWPIPDRTLAISARHCEIVSTAGGAALRDVSTNGTFVNGGRTRLAGDHLLQDGDRIEMGPYTLLVQAQRVRPAALPSHDWPLGAAHRGRAPDTRPLPLNAEGAARGGDPAAMLSGGGPARPGLTEFLRDAAAPDSSNQPITKIRLAQKAVAAPPQPQPPPPQAPVAPKAAPATPAVATATAAPDLSALAQALGLPPQALAGRDAAETTARVAAIARGAVGSLRLLLDRQTQVRRQLGSRAPALLPVRELNPLRLGSTPEACLLALLAPGVDAALPLQRAGAELAAHQDGLMKAFRNAASRLGEEMAPASLEAAVDGDDGLERKARLWDLYGQLWQGIGLAPEQPWSQGFLETALLHLAAAYDEQRPDANAKTPR